MRTIVAIGALVVLVLAITVGGSPSWKSTGKSGNAAGYFRADGNNEGGNNGGSNNAEGNNAEGNNAASNNAGGKSCGSGNGEYNGCHGNRGDDDDDFDNGEMMDDVELFFKIRNKLVEVATNAIAFSQLASLNSFNDEAFEYDYKPPGKLRLYVREVEQEPAHRPFSSHRYPAPTYGGSYGGYRPTAHNKPSYGSFSTEE